MIAHIREIDHAEQSVQSHCQETAALCAVHADGICAGNIGQLAGLLHDAGKLTAAFQKRIRGASEKPDHSSQGARYLCELARRADPAKYGDVSRLIAHIILSHHGIHDWLTSDDADYFAMRTQKDDGYAEVAARIGEITSDAQLLQLLEAASEEYHALSARCRELAGPRKTAYAFYLGMLERFLQSCLIDADRTNTADFMSDSSTERSYHIEKLWEDMSARMQARITDFSMHTDAISIQRCSISERCAAYAEHPVKACRLIVPTGGGKTLSSLRFAIESCKKHGKQKILYTAPFMSILEQNSDVFREIAGDAFFTEHHSNFLSELENGEELYAYELRTEKWDAPVIATTVVQLLNALFSGKSSAVRRMHRLSNAVIIIDEVQSIPLRCVHLFDLAVNFLTHICGTTVVLCSATQPAMEAVKYPLLLDENSSMTGDTAQDFEVFRRTQLISAVIPHGYTYDEASDLCTEKFAENGNLLLIVNTKAAAKALFRRMQERCPEAKVIHLSTNLCPAHRRERIAEIRDLLTDGKPVLCVTTQLIEAGVDISFRCVVRSLAGMDNAAQAAGRCNRNGESETPCPVYLIRLQEEQVNGLEGVQTAQQISQRILESPEVSDYLSVDAQSLYFQMLYQQERNKLSYPVTESGCQTDLLELLSMNRSHYKMSGLPKAVQFSVQAFRTAGDLFEVIDNRTTDVLVPYNAQAEEIIRELDSDIPPERCRELLRKAQKFAVSLYDGQNRRLHENHAVRTLRCGAAVLDGRFYDPDCGVMTQGAEQEVLLF
ncbi:MAG: CRISPR-associated helicase Cas3' [Oscillospiraceae bacterium]|nr:CRISPR-associated helicase Cas3' [Oscillospiraceae bacterium]